MAQVFRVAALQMRSGPDPAANLETIAGFAKQAQNAGANYLQTPEVSIAFCKNRQQLSEVAFQYEGNKDLAHCAEIARETGIYLHIGSLAVLLSSGKFAARSVLFAPDGSVVDFYDKIHLFEANLPGESLYRESDTYQGGDRHVVADLNGFKLGMSLCYDMRFPQHYQKLAGLGADLIAIPSAFTQHTGEAHWHVLVRARAIETGCYVIAAAQGGVHENGRETYGHSLIVGPWGEVLGEQNGQENGLIFADIDRKQIIKARQKLPALAK